MASNYLFFIWITLLLVTASFLTAVNSQGQGCSLVGLGLQNCIFTPGETSFTIEPCCKTLNLALEAGCYCLRSLLGADGASDYPALSPDLALSFSMCYISLPSLAHCHEIDFNLLVVQVPESRPLMTAPPAAALPRLRPPVLPPVQIPPSNEPFVPLPPKVNENNSSIAEMNSRYLSSDSANVKRLHNSRNLIIVTVFVCMYCIMARDGVRIYR